MDFQYLIWIKSAISFFSDGTEKGERREVGSVVGKDFLQQNSALRNLSY